MLNDEERVIFLQELGHLLSELENCRDDQLNNIICEHLTLILLALVSKPD
jgi:hypothetical protein